MPVSRRSMLLVRLAALTAIVSCLVSSSAATSGQTTAHAAVLNSHPRALIVWLDWYPNSDHAGIYVALAKGFYARKGLIVHPRVPSGASDALQLVAHGSGDIAISYEPEVLIARSKGLPVVATAAIAQRPLNCVMALKSSGISRPRQLQGRTVGIAGLASDYTDIAAVVRNDGGDPKRVKTITINYELLSALLARRVDAVEGVYWTWEALQAEQSRHPVNVMRLDRWGVPPYDELVFATGSGQLRAEAATLRAFQAATFQGYAYAVAHPHEAAKILLKAPGVLSTSQALIEQSIRLLTPVFTDTHGRFGSLSASAWQAYADWMTRTQLISAHVNAATALTTSLLP